jgi:hypothetical protein
MSPEGQRGLIALGNITLVGLIGLLGYRTFRGGETPASEAPPATFSPLRYDIKSEGGQRSSVDQHAVTWQELDRPLPPVTPVQPIETAPVVNTPQDLSRIYTLKMASYNPTDPARSSFVVQGGPNAAERCLGIGDNFDGYEVKEIVVEGEGDGRQAMVTVENSGRRETIRLTRQSAP